MQAYIHNSQTKQTWGPYPTERDAHQYLTVMSELKGFVVVTNLTPEMVEWRKNHLDSLDRE